MTTTTAPARSSLLRLALRLDAVVPVVASNALWAAGSLAVAAAGTGGPTTVGTVWIVLQALVVAGFAALQVAGLRRA